MVEDERSITEPLSEALAREGFDTEVAETAASALELARRRAFARAARRDAPRRLGLRRVPRAAGRLARADHHADRPRRGDRSHRGTRAGSRRLHRQAVQRARGGGPYPRRPAPRRRRARPGGRADRDRAVAAGPRPPRRRPRRPGARPHPQGIRAAGAADVRGRLGDHARAPDRRGLGRQLVRLDQDARRARVRAAPQAGRQLALAALHPHRARGGLPIRRAGGAG